MKSKKYYEKIYKERYNPIAVNAALRYSKKYSFDSGNKSTYNNEADAFKHTFGSAMIAMEKGNLYSTIVGLAHEYEYLKNPQKYKNPKGEKIWICIIIK